MDFASNYPDIDRLCKTKLRYFGNTQLTSDDLVGECYLKFQEKQFTEKELINCILNILRLDKEQTSTTKISEEWQYSAKKMPTGIIEIQRKCTLCKEIKNIEDFRKYTYKDRPRERMQTACRQCESKRTLKRLAEIKSNFPNLYKKHVEYNRSKQKRMFDELYPSVIKQYLVQKKKYSKEYLQQNPIHILQEINRIKSKKQINNIISESTPVSKKIISIIKMGTKKITSMKDLVMDLVKTYEDLSDGKITSEQAKTSSHVASTIISACKMQLEYNYMRKSDDTIEFLESQKKIEQS